MDWTIEFDKAIEQYLPDLEVLQDEPMSRHTTFRIGGPAKRMAFPSSREQLVLLMSFAKDYGANPLVIGNGSNLLVPDEGLDRLVIDTSANLNRVERGSGNTVLADAGATLARTADLACKSGLTGLEFAHGIPGTVGGGVCMNAGAYGGEMKQVLRSAAVLFPEEGTPAFRMKNKVSASLKKTRFDRLMALQQEISAEKNRGRIGKIYDVLVEGISEDGIFYYGRSYAEAPDVDGRIYFTALEPLQIGNIVKIEILIAEEYDLTGRQICV